MDRSQLNDRQYAELLDRIFQILAEKGISATTMDLVASRLSMSKRTLYEIFDSKDQMLVELLNRLHEEMSKRINKVIREAGNMMEALANVFLLHQRMMQMINVQFFIDMDRRCHKFRKHYELNSRKWMDAMITACRIGVRQGVFRADVNYDVTVRLFDVQMESLKRMEELFPKDITLVDAFNGISLGLLRSIASEKGMRILDGITERLVDSEATERYVESNPIFDMHSPQG